MNFYIDFFKNWNDFSGRTRRKDYFLAGLVNTIISYGLAFFDLQVFGTIYGLNTLYSIVIFVPVLAITARRLHDTGRSLWWYLSFIFLIPLVIVFFNSQPGANQYGPNPKEGEDIKIV